MAVSVSALTAERTESVAGGYQLVVVSAAEALGDERFVAEWQHLLSKVRSRCKLFMSPEWIAHVARRQDASVLLWLARDSSGDLVGVVPVRRRDFKLAFDVANRVLWNASLRVAEVMGSQPCLPDCHQLLRALIENVMETWPDCEGVYFDALPSDCFCSRAIRAQGAGGRSVVYSPYDERPSIVTTICASFDEYMNSKSAKTRSKLRRKLRMITDSGETKLKRYTDSSDVLGFVEGLSCVSARTWQNRLLGIQYRNDAETCAKFRDLAERQLLRGYLLWRDGQPLAFVVGYQYDGVYYYADVGFDPQAAELSPGTFLLFLILQDLHGYDPPKELNYGVGDAAYKQRFGEVVGTDETVLFLRRGMRNRFLMLSHSGFMAALNGVKKAIGRRVRT